MNHSLYVMDQVAQYLVCVRNGGRGRGSGFIESQPGDFNYYVLLLRLEKCPGHTHSTTYYYTVESHNGSSIRI